MPSLPMLDLAPLGPPVAPFCPFGFWGPLIKASSRKKGALFVRGLLGNLLGGSWVVISRVISPLIWVIITVSLLITPL